MIGKGRSAWQRAWPLLLVAALLGGYWLLPIRGQVVVTPSADAPVGVWPQMRLDPPAPQPGQPLTIWVTDIVPWAYMRLTVDGEPATLGATQAHPGEAWTWQWTLTAPAELGVVVFYHDCHTGCVERGRLAVGGRPAPTVERVGTKLGVTFASSERDWHGRSGWDVEVTYARLADAPFWGVDDLARRVHQAQAKGLRVLVRVDYESGQSLPPVGDTLALTAYLDYLARLAHDARLQGVYGYVIGSGFNALDANALAPERPVTPAWYARVFNGLSQPSDRTDNAVQTLRAANPQARVLVGPVRPWNTDQSGERPHTVDVPWLNYMNNLVAAVDEGARVKAVAGIPFAPPDGFAVQAPGRPDAPELAGRDGASEPMVDLRRAGWGEAQAGFRVYRDWLGIINAYPTTRGLPTYITSTNTFAPDQGTPPAQNYPRGWLMAALATVNAEPQVQALCWFLDDIPRDPQWEQFNLARRVGRMADAADEFDALLQR